MRVSVRLEGFTACNEQLNRMKRATAKAVLKRAGTQAMRPMAAIAAQLAPYDTGDLAKSIEVSAKAGANTIGLAQFAEVMRTTGDRVAARQALRDRRRVAGIGDHQVDLFMGPEQGTKDEAIKAIIQEFGAGENRPPQPYMRPAWDADKAAMLARLGPLLWAEIEKSLARTAARAARSG